MIGRRGPFSRRVLWSELSATKSLPFLPASLRAASRKEAGPGWRRSKTPFVRTNAPPSRATLLRIATALLSGTSLGVPGVGGDEGTSEEFLRLLKELARRGLMRVAAHARELLENPPLLGAESCRDLDVDPDKLVAMPSPAQRRHSAVAQPEGRPALRYSRYLEARLARNVLHLDRSPLRRKRELDGDLAEKVGPLALEELVLLHGEHD